MEGVVRWGSGTPGCCLVVFSLSHIFSEFSYSLAYPDPHDNLHLNSWPIDEFPNVLNDFFSMVGQKLAANVPDSNCHSNEYLTNTNFSTSFFFELVISSDIELEISLLPSNKAYGLYSCPIRVLKCAKSILSSPLAEPINLSVQSGKYPSKLKHAKIIPVYKGDDETDPGNYRPISLLSVFNIIFFLNYVQSIEVILYIKDNELLYKAQYGFREKFLLSMQFWTW